MDASESATKQRQASGSALMIVRMVIMMMMMMMTVNRMGVTIRIAGTRFEQGRRQGG